MGRRFLLGSITSLARWTLSKRTLIAKAETLSAETREETVKAIDALGTLLVKAAHELGWKPKE